MSDILRAIEADDLDTLRRLIGIIDINDAITTYPSQPEGVHEVMTATPLVYAINMKRIEIAKLLLEADAQPLTAVNTFSLSTGGYSSHRFHPVGHAIFLDVPELIEPMLRQWRAIDWSWCAVYDDDDSDHCGHGRPLITMLMSSINAMAAVERMGEFVGIVSDRAVHVKKVEGAFALHVNEAILGRYSTIREALMMLAQAYPQEDAVMGYHEERSHVPAVEEDDDPPF